MQLFRHLTANNIKLKPMNFLRELSMEAYLIENPDVLILDNDDLSTVNILDAEVPIKGERTGKKNRWQDRSISSIWRINIRNNRT